MKNKIHDLQRINSGLHKKINSMQEDYDRLMFVAASLAVLSLINAILMGA